MYKEKIVNLETGEETIRDYNAKEIAEVERAQADSAKFLAELAEKQIAKAALLSKLGITEEEAKLLLS